MSVDVQAELIIDRPREKVASVMLDPKSEMAWIGGLTNVFPLTPGMLAKGSRVERVGSFLSKSFSSIVVVTRDEPGSMVELSADEPFEMKIRYQLTDVDTGTKASIRIQSVGDIDFQLPAAVLNESVLKKISADLDRLKKHVETIAT